MRDHLPQLPDGMYREAKSSRPRNRFLLDESPALARQAVVVARRVDDATQAGCSLKPSVGSTLDVAQRSGLLEIQPTSIARRLIVDSASGRVSGIAVIDSRTKASRVVPARVVVVCASTLESVKLLLNSVSSRHPRGLGNTSGLLGHYIMNKVSRSVTFLMDLGEEGVLGPLSASESFVIPRYENLGSQTADVRGGFGMWGAIHGWSSVGAAGLSLTGPVFALIGNGGVLAVLDNQVELDRDVVDEWGNPTCG